MGRKHIPKYRHHKSTNRAVVTLNGHDHYLGKWESPGSRAKYDRLIATWLANDRRLPETQPDGVITVGAVLVAFMEHALVYYRKNGEPTKEVASFREALRPLRQLFSTLPAREFGPLRLKAVREKMIEAGLARSTINNRTARIKRVFKWATENELVEPSIYNGLRAVSGLKRGRTRAPEPKKIVPVSEKDLYATLPHMPPPVAAMAEIQFLTGMRPGEVVIMRSGDIDRSGKVWIYRPSRHKTEHHGIERLVPIGPRAQEILRPALKADPQAFLSSPREAEEARNRRRRQERKTPMTPSHRRRKPKKSRKRPPGDHYTTDSYGRAVEGACVKARVKRWRPNQLHHACATRLRGEFGIEAARVILGHRSASTTEIYAELDQARALSLMESVG